MQSDYLLTVDNKYYNILEVECFTKMLKDPSYCYKFYWLEAIVNLINENVCETTLDDIINEMIVNAWYSVVEYHIHLSGIVNGETRDGLERAVLHLSEISSLPSFASRYEIKQAIKQFEKQLHKEKTVLTNMVPYRALSGFFNQHGVKVNWENKSSLIDFIREFDSHYAKLPYVFGEGSALERKVLFSQDWISMINDNTVEILGWIQYEKLKWLQNVNPEVPGLVYKLKPGDNVRKLEHVRNLWNGVIRHTQVLDIYTGAHILADYFDVDHFVPWSFVMNDELWNLMPMDSSLNSSKSNNLPVWDRFFNEFATNQFKLYKLIYESQEIHALYMKCYKDNLHSIWAQQELYKQGNNRTEFFDVLSKNMRPIYDSARRQGYSLWQYGM